MIMLTKKKAAVLFLDLQEEIVKNSRARIIQQLDMAISGLANFAAMHGIWSNPLELIHL